MDTSERHCCHWLGLGYLHQNLRLVGPPVPLGGRGDRPHCTDFPEEFSLLRVFTGSCTGRLLWSTQAQSASTMGDSDGPDFQESNR